MRIVLVALLVLFATTAQAERSTYRVTVESPSATEVNVETTFPLQSDTIGLAVTSSETLPNGQADLVRNLTIFSGNEEISWEAVPGGDWKLAGVSSGDVVTVTYDIALEHEQHSWGPGIDEVGYRTDDGLFFTGWSLFMLPGFETTVESLVSFDLPTGWQASTPWQATEGGYIAPTLMELGRNCMFLGTHVEETIRLGEFEFVMAIGSDIAAAKPLFVETMTPLLPAFVQTFGGLPARTRFLMVANSSDHTDGGAFTDSYSMLIEGPVDETSSVIWGHGVAHELFHFWNGHTIRPDDPSDSEWFKEGFTDYYTILHRSRAGLDTKQNTLRKIENCARRFTLARLLMRQDDSLRAAGADKHNKRFLVYAGGTLVALVLDIQIREASDNQRSLDTMMAAMYEEFGTSDSAYNYDDLLRVATKVCGRDMTDFFDRYVSGNEYLDATSYLEMAGLRLDQAMDEFYITEDDSPSRQQSVIRAGMFGW